jgi:hypothetical protein
MMTFEFQGPTRVCATTNRELRAGEKVFSGLFDDGGQFVRKDFAAEAWSGPPEGVIAWWVGRIPDAGRPARPTINDDLLVDCFEHLTDTADLGRQRFRYVVLLLLMRRKRFAFEDARKQDGRETIVVRDVKSGRRHESVDPQMTETEMDAVRDEVFRVLGWN